MKKAIIANFPTLIWFYKYLGSKIYITVFIALFLGLLDGLSLSMFLPLIQIMATDSITNTEGWGNLKFILNGLQNSIFGLNLLSILCFMLIFFSLKGLLQFFNELHKVSMQQEFIRKIRINLLTALNNVNYNYFIKSNIGRIQNSLTGEVDRLQVAYSYFFLTIVQVILTTVYISFIFFIDYKFALILIIAGLLIHLLLRAVFQQTRKASKSLTDDSNQFQGQIIQHINHFKYLSATGMLTQYSKHLTETIYKIEFSRRKIGLLNGIQIAIREPLIVFTLASVIFLQVVFLKGLLTHIIISLLFFYRALNSLTQTQNSWNNFLGISGSLENIQKFQDDLNQQKQYKKRELFHTLDEKIEIKDLHFSYGNTKVLNEINLIIRKNQRIAFVGESGSGKTTLVNLISGLLEFYKGEIIIDDKNIKELNLQSYQKKIGYVSQDPVIFNDTIFNNVSFWDEKNEDNLKRFKHAIKDANINNFVAELHLQEDTILGNNGINLSGGQKQRIAIARELYKDVEILILDEATSAMDSETESIVQQNIYETKENYTILIITHRLSTIKNVDKIVLMEKGNIAGIGTFHELFTKFPNFKNIVELQEL